MRFRATILLAGLVMIMGGYYFLYQRPHAEAKKSAAEFEKRFFRSDPADIVNIKVENRDGAVEISHTTQGWMIERPQRYRPDDGMIKKLLETIATGRLTKIVGNTADLPQFGFDKPILSLTLGLGNKVEVLVISQQNPTDTGYYAYSQTMGKIFLVNKELPKEMYLRLYDLREKRLYPAILPENIGRIVMARGRETLDLVFTDSGWQMLAPINAKAATEEVKILLEKLTRQKVEAFIPWDKRLGRLPQRIQLKILDRSARLLVENSIYYLGTGESEGIIVHHAGDAEAAQTRRELWELLQIDATDLMERHIFPVNSADITRIVFAGREDNIVIERKGSQWLKNGKKIDHDKIPPVLDTLRNWKATKLVRGREISPTQHTVIEVAGKMGVTKLAVSDIDMNREVSDFLPTMNPDISAKERQITYWLATSTALPEKVIVSSYDINRLIDQLRLLK